MSEKLRNDAWPLIPINTIHSRGLSTKADNSAEANVQTVLGTSKTIAVKEHRAYTETSDQKHL